MQKSWYAMLIFENTVLVFDLDDTLYKEVEFQRSGFRKLAAMAEELSGQEIADSILDYYEKNPRADIIGHICSLTGFAESFRETLIWTYRLHEPALTFESASRSFLEMVRRRCAGCAILTDGRVATQVAKVRALGLDWMPVYVSEAWDSAKPDRRRFELIQQRWPGRRYVYVGDNPAKDFHAPSLLGWTTVGVTDSGQNIHPQAPPLLDGAAIVQPDYWVSALPEIADLFHNEDHE